MTDFISVIIPSYNPDRERLNRVMGALQNQTLPLTQWELILIDNNSSPAISIDLSWHPNQKVVTEQKQGLTYARLRGFRETSGTIIVMVDDDNLPDQQYLQNILSIFQSDENMGAAGGKSLPLFEIPPPVWLNPFYSNLAIRDLGDSVLTTAWQKEYPSFSPIGAGMAIRKAALADYLQRANTETGVIGDRTGNSLSSGGDNDIVLFILTSGWMVGYFPVLTLQHIIPGGRMEVDYLARLLHDTNKSWVQVLEKHQINPWKAIPAWSVPLRKIRSWIVNRAWKNKVQYLKWCSSCGLFDGQAAIQHRAKA